jgi:membrane protein DedA with SNARE-associated domain
MELASQGPLSFVGREIFVLEFFTMFHELLQTWFHWVDAWGYAGIILLMTLESSIVPVPSEIVIAPAAFWAAQGRFTFVGVVLAGTLGSYIGSAANYWFFRWAGLPVAQKYGKYFFLPEDKLTLAEDWLRDFGVPGVFASRFLPVVRHLISIPAGILRMPFGRFSLATIFGAGIWCTILAWFGQEVLGDRPDLLDSPETMIAAMKAKLFWFVAAVVVFLALYMVVIIFKKKGSQKIIPGALS